MNPYNENPWLGTHNTLIGDMHPAMLVVSVKKKEKKVREMISFASANEHTKNKIYTVTEQAEKSLDTDTTKLEVKGGV